MSKKVNRSAGSGKFVSNAAAARWPTKTVTETVGSGTSNKTPVRRSAATGQFVTGDAARRNPGGTITQRV
ncbi:ABC transporter ATP-binding protein [Gordonia terrae]|uniref:ABC transporter ATP-binding protein n=1 Tax=Gordonia terrae TaxID=2055 RepID=A0A2I1RAW9_9ACTN|nr:ABC transporter ATP-binding protein [Gordonia terrae]